MIPESIIKDEIKIKTMPSKTYFMDIQKNRIYGFCDGKEAVKQAVYNILNTEKNKYIIYNGIYGRQFEDLFGKSVYYVMPQIERRIKEALFSDDRIKDITDVEISPKRGSISVRFNVVSIFGEFEGETEI